MKSLSYLAEMMGKGNSIYLESKDEFIEEKDFMGASFISYNSSGLVHFQDLYQDTFPREQ